MRIYIESNSCTRRNKELSRLCKYFILNGYEIVNNPKKAVYILLNTCAFKEREEDYSVSRIAVLKDYPAKLVVFGCLPDIAPSKFKEFSHLAHIAPRNIDKIDSYFENITFKFSDIDDLTELADYINLNTLQTAIQKFRSQFELSNDFCLRTARHAVKKIRTAFGLSKKYFNLFICRGCLGNCSYCAIRRAIGSLRSQHVEQIINQLKESIDAGYRNFVILGDDVGAYGQDINSTFPELLSRLLDESNRLSVRSSSKLKQTEEIAFYIEELNAKWLISYIEKLLDLLPSKQFRSICCPMQSGSDRILKLMNRYHNSKDIADCFLKVRSVNPAIQLSTHIVVGFPSEKEEDFDETLYFLNKIHFDSVIIFPYHEKENTLAVKIHPKVPDHVIRERIKKAQKYLKRQKTKVYLSCPSN